MPPLSGSFLAGAVSWPVFCPLGKTENGPVLWNYSVWLAQLTVVTRDSTERKAKI